MENTSRAEFNKWVHRFGRGSSTLLCAVFFGLPILGSIIYDAWPNFGQLWPAFVAVVLFMAPWTPASLFSYMTTMGPGALYQAEISGNLANLRMPAVVGTITSLGIKPNTDECHTLGIIACAGSVFATLAVIALGVALAQPLEPILKSPILKPGFNYVIPALFGGLVAQTVLKNKKTFFIYLVPLTICLFFNYMTKVTSNLYMLIGMFASVVVCYVDYKNSKKPEKTS